MPVYTPQARLSRRKNEGLRQIGQCQGDARRWWVAVWLLVAPGVVASCVVDAASGYTCDHPIPGRKDAWGNPEPCPPAAVQPDGCTEVCVSTASESEGWTEHPFLFWVGPIGQAPDCPDSSPLPGSTHYGGLTIPPKCNPCACDSPNGSCELPQTIKAHTAACPGTGATEISFDPLSGWDGTCSTANPIPACGGVDCIQSLTLDTLDVIETGCTPRGGGDSGVTPYFGLEARTCNRNDEAYGTGCPGGKAETCAPSPPPGFRLCISQVGAEDSMCPPQYPYKEIYYDDQKVNDHRKCAACTCGAPSDSLCTGCIAVYSDDTCSVERACYPVASTSTGPECYNIVPAGVALLSKQALNITYTPGSCEPGGGETGTLDLPRAKTYCCIEPLQ